MLANEHDAQRPACASPPGDNPDKQHASTPLLFVIMVVFNAKLVDWIGLCWVFVSVLYCRFGS